MLTATSDKHLGEDFKYGLQVSMESIYCTWGLYPIYDQNITTVPSHVFLFKRRQCLHILVSTSIIPKVCPFCFTQRGSSTCCVPLPFSSSLPLNGSGRKERRWQPSHRSWQQLRRSRPTCMGFNPTGSFGAWQSSDLLDCGFSVFFVKKNEKTSWTLDEIGVRWKSWWVWPTSNGFCSSGHGEQCCSRHPMTIG